MKKFIGLLLLAVSYFSHAQSVVPLRGDTIKIYKQGGTAELVLQNKTKDSLGLLVNIGNGVTAFLRSHKINDSTIVIGKDTLILKVGSTTGGGSGSSDSLKHLFVDTAGGAGHSYCLVDSSHRKWKLIPCTDSSIFQSKYRSDTARNNTYNAINGKQAQLANGNGTTVVGNQVNSGGTVTANILYAGNKAIKEQHQTNLRVGDTTKYIGNIFTQTFSSGSLPAGFTNGGSQTLSFTGSHLTITGGGVDYTSLLTRNDFTSANQWCDTVKFIPNTIAGNSYGLIIGILDNDGYPTGIRVQFGTATGLMHIYFRFYDGTILNTSAAAITMASTDSLWAILKRNDNGFTATFKNMTAGGSDSATVPFTFNTLVGVGAPAPATGHIGIGSISASGGPTVYYWSHTNNESVGRVVIQGDSRWCGAYTSSSMDVSAVSQLFPFRNTVVKLGGAGDRSSDALNDTTELDRASPAYAFWTNGINDFANSVPVSTFSSHVVAWVNYCLAHVPVITPVFIDLPPNKLGSTKVFSDSLRAIAARYGIKMVDGTYDGLRSGTTYNMAYSIDTVHENDAGYAFEVGLVRSQAPEMLGSYTLSNIPPGPIGGERLLAVDPIFGTQRAMALESAYQRIYNPVIISPTGTANTAVFSSSGPGSNTINASFHNSSPDGFPGLLFFDDSSRKVFDIYYGNSGTVVPKKIELKTLQDFGGIRFRVGNTSTNANRISFDVEEGAFIPDVHTASARPTIPLTGMIYYDTDSLGLVIYNGSAWAKVGGGSSVFALVASGAYFNGRVGIGNFSSTTIAADLDIRTGTQASKPIINAIGSSATTNYRNDYGTYVCGQTNTTVGNYCAFDFVDAATPSSQVPVTRIANVWTDHTGGANRADLWFLTLQSNLDPEMKLIHNGNFIVGHIVSDNSTAKIQSTSTSAQFAAHYDATHYTTWATGSTGNLTISPTGGKIFYAARPQLGAGDTLGIYTKAQVDSAIKHATDSVAALRDTLIQTTTADPGNFTVTVAYPINVWIASDLTGTGSAAVITLPSASGMDNKEIRVWNKNADGSHLYTFSSAVTLPDGTTSTAVDNHKFSTYLAIGGVWVRQSNQ